MEKIEQLKQILIDLDERQAEVPEALEQICALFDVVGRSEQLVCDDCGNKQFVHSKKQGKDICLNCWEEEN